MSELQCAEQPPQLAERDLRQALARADAALAGAGPVLRHMLHLDGDPVISEECLARIGGMATHMARQLLAALAGESEHLFDPLLAGLTADDRIVQHLHALIMEAHMADVLERRCGIDPVLSPLLQESAALIQPPLAGVAMAAITAQARYGQHVRRMELRVGELPGTVFHRALLALRAAGSGEAAVERADLTLRRAYAEGDGRLALLARLVASVDSPATDQKTPKQLTVDHAGLAVFLTALATVTGQPRDLVALSLHPAQAARLALALRAVGLDRALAQLQWHRFHPDIDLPDGFDRLPPDRAMAVLAESPWCHAGLMD